MRGKKTLVALFQEHGCATMRNLACSDQWLVRRLRNLLLHVFLSIFGSNSHQITGSIHATPTRSIFSLKSELDHFSFSAIIMYKNTTIWDHLWPRKLQLFKRKIITSAEAQNQGSPTRRWFYAPQKSKHHSFMKSIFKIFSFEKELGSIWGSIASIWPSFSWGSPVPRWDLCLRRFRGVPGRGGCHRLGYLSLGEIWTSALRAGWDAFFRIFWGCHRNVDVKKNWINLIKDSCKAICTETYINKLFKIVCGIFDPAWSSCAACELLRRNKVWVCEWLSFLWFLALKDSEKGPTGNSKHQPGFLL